MNRTQSLRSSWLALACWLAGTASSMAQTASAPAPEPGAEPLRTAERRLVKRFDFDEAALGNLEDVPMHWLKYASAAFPHYLQGRFDPQVGRARPPSFRLQLQGNSLAYYYCARDIPAKPNSDYLVVAWAKTQGLTYARAYFSAYFLDRDGVKIAESERFSDMLGPTGPSEQWHCLTVALPGCYERSRFIGLQVWLTQPDVWQSQHRPDWQIYHQDIDGLAWFDDVTVYRLPRVELTTPTPGNVFPPNVAPKLQIELGDPDGQGVQAHLLVQAADGTTVLAQPVPVSTARTPQPIVLDLFGLAPGLYHATLTVHANNQQLVRRELDFARVMPLPRPPSGAEVQFGVNLGSVPPGTADAVLALTQQLGVERLKLSIWQASATGQQPLQPNPDFEHLLGDLVSRRASIVATFAQPPEALAQQYSSLQKSLLDIFDGPPELWRPYLAFVVARYADVINYWQIGRDGDDQLLWDARLPQTLRLVRDEIARLAPSPALVSPWSVTHRLPDQSLPANYLCLHVPDSVPPEQIPAQAAQFHLQDRQQLWVALASLDPDTYQRIPRLIDFAKRVVFARLAGVDTVFVSPPWHYHQTTLTTTAQPDEEFLVYRTLANALAGTQPAGKIYLGPGIECYVFDHGPDSTLVVWADEADEQGLPCRLWLGEHARTIDLWGRTEPLKQIADQQELLVGRIPILVDRADSWLARLWASLTVTPQQIESAFQRHPIRVSFTNYRPEPLTGRLELLGPRRWQLRPWQMRFALQPGQTFQGDLTIRFPYNEPAGRKILPARLMLDADHGYDFHVSLPLELNLQGIDIDTIPQILDNRLIVRQSITNMTSRPVNFRAVVTAPNRPPQRRPVSALAAGQSTVKTYVFDDAGALLGQELRVCLEEVQGPRIFNEMLAIR